MKNTLALLYICELAVLDEIRSRTDEVTRDVLFDRRKPEIEYL